MYIYMYIASTIYVWNVNGDHWWNDADGGKTKLTEKNSSHWLDCVWNVMAHAQKPDFAFRQNGRIHLNRRGASVQLTTGSRGVRISGSNAGYSMFQGSVKSTGYVIYDFPSERHFVHYRSRTVCPRGENSATVLNTLRTGDADLRF